MTVNKKRSKYPTILMNTTILMLLIWKEKSWKADYTRTICPKRGKCIDI